MEQFRKTALRTEWDFFYFAASVEEYVPLKLEAAVETVLSDDDKSEDVDTEASTSSSSSASESESEQAPKASHAAPTGGPQDPHQHQFAMLRKTIHVVSSWNQPATGSAATRMACGRQLLTSSLKMITYEDIATSPGTLCNHPGCRQIWSNFDA